MDGFSIFILFLICVELNIDVKFMLLRYEYSFLLFYILYEKVNGVFFFFLLRYN